MNIKIGVGAQGDLIDAVEFYQRHDREYASRFILALHEHFTKIAANPLRAPPVDGPEIVAVAHERRHPRYWFRR